MFEYTEAWQTLIFYTAHEVNAFKYLGHQAQNCKMKGSLQNVLNLRNIFVLFFELVFYSLAFMTMIQFCILCLFL